MWETQPPAAPWGDPSPVASAWDQTPPAVAWGAAGQYVPSEPTKFGAEAWSSPHAEPPTSASRRERRKERGRQGGRERRNEEKAQRQAAVPSPGWGSPCSPDLSPAAARRGDSAAPPLPTYADAYGFGSPGAGGGMHEARSPTAWGHGGADHGSPWSEGREAGRGRENDRWGSSLDQEGGKFSQARKGARARIQTAATAGSEPFDGSNDSGSDEDWWTAPKLRSLLAHGGQELDRLVTQLHLSRSKGRSGRGGLNELQAIAKEVVSHAGIGQSALQNFEVLHHRFDFSGDGALDLEETKRLFRVCLRAFQQRTDSDEKARKSAQLPFKNVEDDFVIMKKLGEGGQGAMYLASLKNRPDELRCVKFYDKSNANAPLDDIKEEFEIMRKMDSPFVARTFEIFEDYSFVYLVNEPYFGGDLTNLVQKATEANIRLTEDWFKKVLVQPAKGIVYLNHQHLIHCDLKEANIMVATDSHWEHPHVVLIDFGLMQMFTGDTAGVCGTPGYIPPETWSTNYWVPKGDVFSLGVVFFQLMTGIDWLFGSYMHASGMEDVARFTCTAQPPFQQLQHTPVFQALVARMLEKDVWRRCTITQVMEDAWFTQGQTGMPVPPAVVQNLQRLGKKQEFKNQLAEMMLDRFNLAKLYELNAAFVAMDLDGSGSIEEQEAQRGAAQIAATLGLTPADVLKLVSSMVDSNGIVSYRRFMAMMIRQQMAFTTGDLWARFCQMDTNRNGVLEQNELLAVMRSMGYSDAASHQLLSKVDINRDGKISFQEFKAAMLDEDGGRSSRSRFT